MSPRALWLTIGCLLVVGVGFTWMRVATQYEREFNGLLDTFELASSRGDGEAVLRITSPSAMETLRKQIAAALADTEAELQKRPLVDAMAIVKLRARHTAAELAALDPQSMVREMFAGASHERNSPRRAEDVSVEDGTATATVVTYGNFGRSEVGRAPFFQRVDGRWSLDWMLLTSAEAEGVDKTYSTPEARRGITKRLMQDRFPGTDFDALWSGPRQ